MFRIKVGYVLSAFEGISKEGRSCNITLVYEPHKHLIPPTNFIEVNAILAFKKNLLSYISPRGDMINCNKKFYPYWSSHS